MMLAVFVNEEEQGDAKTRVQRDGEKSPDGARYRKKRRLEEEPKRLRKGTDLESENEDEEPKEAKGKEKSRLKLLENPKGRKWRKGRIGRRNCSRGR